MSKSNLSLAGTGELGESVNNALVKLKLGRHELMFQDGEWIAGKLSFGAIAEYPAHSFTFVGSLCRTRQITIGTILIQ